MTNLYQRLRRHDWYWEYSDQFLRHAADEETFLKLEIQKLGLEWSLVFKSFTVGERSDYDHVDEQQCCYNDEWIQRGWNMYRPPVTELAPDGTHQRIKSLTETIEV